MSTQLPSEPRLRLSQHHRHHRAGAGLFATLLAVSSLACRQTESAKGAGEPVGSKAPDSIFAYLLERYDGDRDGVVSREEYGRGDEEFGRLDKQVDGVLDAADFKRSGRRLRGLSFEDAPRMRALHLIAWYLQHDRTPAQIDAEEIERAHGTYDANGDGRIGRREFEARAEKQRQFGRRPAGRDAGLLEVETTDPWERLVIPVDANDDGFLTAAELGTFFHASRPGGVWSFSEADTYAPEAPVAGDPAPDFTLWDPSGTVELTLSDFAGERPVALIFGSYT